MPTSATSYYDHARVALVEHRIEEADDALTRALAACGPDDVELAFRVRISRTWIVFERSGLDSAGRVIREIRAEADAAGLAAMVATADVQLGTLLARAGDLTAAWRELSRVDPELLPGSDRPRFLLNRGTLASELGRLDEAVADLSEAALGDKGTPIADMSRHNLGWVQFLRGDLPAALRAMGEADPPGADVDHDIARLDRARVLLEAGLAGEALDLLQTVSRSTALNQAEVDLERARAQVLLGDRATAARLALASAERFMARGEPVGQRRSETVALLAQPDPAPALSLWRESSAAGDWWVAQQCAAVAVGSWNDHPGSPPARLLRDAESLSRSPVLSRMMTGQLSLARFAVHQGRLTEARRRLKATSRRLLEEQLRFASLDLRAALAIHGYEMAFLELSLAERLRKGRADALIDASERWRAVTRPSPRVTPVPDPALAEAATRLRRLRTEFAADGGNLGLATAVNEAERELQQLSWTSRYDVPAQGMPLAPTTLRQVARSEGVTMAVCLPRGTETWAVVLGGRQTKLVRLGRTETLTALVTATHADLTARAVLPPGHPMLATVEASLGARLATLRTALISPLGQGIGQLLVVPTLALTGVPWTALAPGPVAVSPTASSWFLGRRLVAEPRVAALSGPGLASADLEAENVRRCWSSEGPVPTLADALSGFDVVHVAAHGTHRSDNPLFSSLHLAEGDVVAHELEGLPLRASHVVLSACEVGRSAARPGDQPLGLTSTLLSAGVACVVAPVAPVNDQLAARVMHRYHRGLAAGGEASVALRDAAAGDPSAGAFVCFGSPWKVG
ncbi:CHAT domain-containing protein [Tessaracoccus bendigoensis DSM 12906]|uniref:CHAT domain-containing protein n=1 Tax=Tessaracoccus bendigoensis DSM 12906 TaxID=1123357 RepID=A0A1M6K374_9ACTN|nr:CHAT domain-containing tetratricopeptide repeat protein [Tessaracoccus bendigoensis]SHJ53433.1 CHAT domain-containing protein [Tessaracoccus bendigoensis DSM 12906]